MKSKTHRISKVIASDAKSLFTIVSNFENYNAWNTVIPNAKGVLAVGNELQLMINMSGTTKPFNPTVIAITPDRSFLLSKVLLSKFLGELSHQFEFKDLGNHRTEFIQTWTGKGVLVKLMWSKISEGFADFETFNTDLEKYVRSQ